MPLLLLWHPRVATITDADTCILSLVPSGEDVVEAVDADQLYLYLTPLVSVEDQDTVYLDLRPVLAVRLRGHLFARWRTGFLKRFGTNFFKLEE